MRTLTFASMIVLLATSTATAEQSGVVDFGDRVPTLEELEAALGGGRRVLEFDDPNPTNSVLSRMANPLVKPSSAVSVALAAPILNQNTTVPQKIESSDVTYSLEYDDYAADQRVKNPSTLPSVNIGRLIPEDSIHFSSVKMAISPLQPIAIEPARQLSTVMRPSSGFSLPVEFTLNSARISSRFKPHLDRVAAYLLSRPEIRLDIVGHADATGDAASNMRLSLRRAEATGQALAKRGVPEDRLWISGRGETEPMYADAYDARNRRVEFLPR